MDSSGKSGSAGNTAPSQISAATPPPAPSKIRKKGVIAMRGSRIERYYEVTGDVLFTLGTLHVFETIFFSVGTGFAFTFIQSNPDIFQEHGWKNAQHFELFNVALLFYVVGLVFLLIRGAHIRRIKRETHFEENAEQPTIPQRLYRWLTPWIKHDV